MNECLGKMYAKFFVFFHQYSIKIVEVSHIMCERQWVADYAYDICQKHLNQEEISALANKGRKQSGSLEEKG